MWRVGRAGIAVLAGIGALAVGAPAVAQLPPPPDLGSSPPAAAPSAPDAAPVDATASALPPLSGTGSLTGTPDPTALSPGAGDELTFSSHGFIRAPMRMG